MEAGPATSGVSSSIRESTMPFRCSANCSSSSSNSSDSDTEYERPLLPAGLLPGLPGAPVYFISTAERNQAGWRSIRHRTTRPHRNKKKPRIEGAAQERAEDSRNGGTNRVESPARHRQLYSCTVSPPPPPLQPLPPLARGERPSGSPLLIRYLQPEEEVHAAPAADEVVLQAPRGFPAYHPYNLRQVPGEPGLPPRTAYSRLYGLVRDEGMSGEAAERGQQVVGRAGGGLHISIQPDGRLHFGREEQEKRYTRLKVFVLRGYADVTDASLRALSSLRLQLLDVTGTAVTRAGIRDFLLVNPNCRVLHDTRCRCSRRC